MDFYPILEGLVNAAPGLALWITALILASILMKRGRGRPERLLVIGSSLLLAGSIISVFQPLVRESLPGSEMEAVNAALILSITNLFIWLVRLPGIICLFYAIWKNFNKKKGIPAG